MSFLSNAAQYVAHNEAFRSRAYWDVNAWRIGYGSDTRTAAQIKVKRGDFESQIDALANLAVRLKEFDDTCRRQCPQTYDTLPDRARIALVDMAYNYGSLPDSVATAINMRLRLDLIAASVERHAADNHGVNKHRREDEAAKIRGS